MEISKKFDRFHKLKVLMGREVFSHSVFTPESLVDEMIVQSAKDLTEDAKILVWNIEFAISLVEDYPFTKPNLTVFTNGDPALEKIAGSMGINSIAKLDNDMKFDLALANPPFSSGKKLLYPEFLNLCLDKCETVAMVMPYDMVSRQSRLRNYQETVTRHSSYVSEDIAEHFKGVSVGRISYVIASKSVENEVPEFENIDPFASVPVLYPRRKRMQSIKASGGDAVCKLPKGDKVTVLDKIHKGDEAYTYTSDASKYAGKKSKSNSPWLLVTNHCPSQGKFNTTVVKNDGSVVLGKWVFAVEVASKSEGKKLSDWLRTPKMVKHIADLLEANNGTYGASKALFARLPWFE